MDTRRRMLRKNRRLPIVAIFGVSLLAIIVLSIVLYPRMFRPDVPTIDPHVIDGGDGPAAVVHGPTLDSLLASAKHFLFSLNRFQVATSLVSVVVVILAIVLVSVFSHRQPKTLEPRGTDGKEVDTKEEDPYKHPNIDAPESNLVEAWFFSYWKYLLFGLVVIVLIICAIAFKKCNYEPTYSEISAKGAQEVTFPPKDKPDQPGLTPGKAALRQYGFADNVEDFQYRIPTGLTNVGNTCYMASTLQCLAWMLPSLKDVFKKRFKNAPNQADEREKFKRLLCDIITRLQAGEQLDQSYMKSFKMSVKDVGWRVLSLDSESSSDPNELLALIYDILKEDSLLADAIIKPLLVTGEGQRKCGCGHDKKADSTYFLTFPIKVDDPDIKSVQGLIDRQFTSSILKDVGNDNYTCPDCDHKTCRLFEGVKYVTSDIFAIQVAQSESYDPSKPTNRQYPRLPTEDLQVGDKTYERMEAFIYFAKNHYISCMRMPSPSNVWFCADDYIVRMYQEFPEFVDNTQQYCIVTAFYR